MKGVSGEKHCLCRTRSMFCKSRRSRPPRVIEIANPELKLAAEIAEYLRIQLLESFSLKKAPVRDAFWPFLWTSDTWKRVETLRVPCENRMHKAEQINAAPRRSLSRRRGVASQLVTFLFVT